MAPRKLRSRRLKAAPLKKPAQLAKKERAAVVVKTANSTKANHNKKKKTTTKKTTKKTTTKAKHARVARSRRVAAAKVDVGVGAGLSESAMFQRHEHQIRRFERQMHSNNKMRLSRTMRWKLRQGVAFMDESPIRACRLPFTEQNAWSTSNTKAEFPILWQRDEH